MFNMNLFLNFVVQGSKLRVFQCSILSTLIIKSNLKQIPHIVYNEHLYKDFLLSHYRNRDLSNSKNWDFFGSLSKLQFTLIK